MHENTIGAKRFAFTSTPFVLTIALLIAAPAFGEIVGPFKVVVRGADGTAELRLDCATMRCSSFGERQAWELDAPVILRDASTGRPLVRLQKGGFAASGIHLQVSFTVENIGGPASVEITSPEVPIGPVENALGGVTAAITVTDTNADGAQIVGEQDDGEIARAVFNGDTTFATLLAGLATPTPFTTLAAHQDFPAQLVYSPLTESGAPLGTVSSVGVSLKFGLSAKDSASGTTVFSIAELDKVASHRPVQPDTNRVRIEVGGGSGATANLAKVVADGPKTLLNVVACAGNAPTAFDITSGSVSFPAIADARARATVGLTLADANANAASLVGAFAGGEVYRAFYNDVAATPATGTTFATLQPALAVVKQNSSLSQIDEFGAGGTFSATDESAALLGSVSSLSAAFRFTLSAGDCATATSAFVIDGCGNDDVDQGEACDDGNNLDGDGCSADCAFEGACCTDGPGTQSDCIVGTEADCVAGGGTYLGDATVCGRDTDCEALLVTMDSMSAEATPRGVLLRWTTATEVDTIGFRVLREDPAERREKRLAVVADMIPAAGNGLAGATYEVFDDSPSAVRALHYYIEDIDIHGKVTRHGPILINRGERQAPGARTAK